MKDIMLYAHDDYKNNEVYKLVDDGIYEIISDADGFVSSGDYVMALTFTLEAEFDELDDRRFPLEDILTEYLVSVSREIHEVDNDPLFIIEFIGDLEDLQRLKEIIGKHIYYEKFVEFGKPLKRLVME